MAVGVAGPPPLCDDDILIWLFLAYDSPLASWLSWLIVEGWCGSKVDALDGNMSGAA